MKKILILLVLISTRVFPFYGQLKDIPVKFISLDGNYDYETIYYSNNGIISSFTNLCYSHPELHKGDSISISTEIKEIEIPGDGSWSETEVVNEIKLLKRGKLSHFLESKPRIEYVFKESMGSIYEELLPQEMNLFIMATEDEYMQEALTRNDEGTIVVYLFFHSLVDGESWEDTPTPPKINGEIKYRTDEKEEFIMYFGLSPDYDKTEFYVHLNGNKFQPVYFDY